MAQQINDNFQLLAGLPIDDRIRKTTIAERDAISSTRRFQGLQCFVEQTQTLYLLLGGILNSNWVGISGSNVSNGLETVIDGFYALLAGKTTPLDWEVNDKFRGWIGNRYLVGTILSLPVSIPSDIDNPAKVELAVDSDVLNSVLPKIQFPADGIATSYDIGTSAAVIGIAIEGILLDDNDWTQAGSVITFTFVPALNERIKLL